MYLKIEGPLIPSCHGYWLRCHLPPPPPPPPISPHPLLTHRLRRTKRHRRPRFIDVVRIIGTVEDKPLTLTQRCLVFLLSFSNYYLQLDKYTRTLCPFMFLQKDEENLIKYRESIHKIKSKRFYDKFNETVCEIEDDVSTFIFEETCDNNNQDNQDITLNDNLNTDKECDTKKDDDIICLID